MVGETTGLWFWAKIKRSRLYLIFFNYWHFYFSCYLLTQMFYVTTRFSALQNTQKNYMTTSTSRSLTSVWEAQNPIKQIMNHQQAKHMRPCLLELWTMESKTFSSIFHQSPTSWRSMTAWLCPYLRTTPYTFGKILSVNCSSFYVIWTQSKPIQYSLGISYIFDHIHSDKCILYDDDIPTTII